MEISFLDLAVITRITPNTPLEKLGGLINSSIFDASNIAGTLKQKSLIEFSANYPGPNSMNVTEQGNALIREANEHSADSFDKLDETILQHLSGGKRFPSELQTTLNLRPKDLALRIYKESKQGFVTYDIKNGNVELLLTEKGFLKAKNDQQQIYSTSTAQPRNLTGATQSPNSIQQNTTTQQQMTNSTIPSSSNSSELSTSTQNNVFNDLNLEKNNKNYNVEKPALKNESKRWIIILVLLILLALIYLLDIFVLSK